MLTETHEDTLAKIVAEPSSRPMLLNNHLLVLMCIAADPDVRLRDMAEAVGLTERAVFAIVHDLERADIITRTRVGRRNQYTIERQRHLRTPLGPSCTIGELIERVLTPTR